MDKFEFDMDKLIIDGYGEWKDRTPPKPSTTNIFSFVVIDYEICEISDEDMFNIYVSVDDSKLPNDSDITNDDIGSHIPEVNNIMIYLGIGAEEMEGVFGGARLGKTNEEITQMLLDYGWIEDKNLGF